MFAADFHPTDTNIIVTCGKSHLYFWTLEGNSLNKKQGLFEVNCTIGSVCLRGTWEGLAFKGASRQFSLSTCFSDKHEVWRKRGSLGVPLPTVGRPSHTLRISLVIKWKEKSGPLDRAASGKQPETGTCSYFGHPGFAKGGRDFLCSVPHSSRPPPLTTTLLELSVALGFHSHLGVP